MKVYKKYFKETTLFINDNVVEITADNLNIGIKTSFGKSKLIPYESKFNYNGEIFDILSLFQIQDKSGIEIVKRFKGISNGVIPDDIYNNFISKATIYINYLLKNKSIDIILVPSNNSKLLTDIVEKLKNKFSNDIIIFSNISKSNINNITVETENEQAKLGSEEVLNRFKKSGKQFDLKKIPKRYARNFRNFFTFNIDNNYIVGSNILILDDVLSTGTTIKELIRMSYAYKPNNIISITLFKVK